MNEQDKLAAAVAGIADSLKQIAASLALIAKNSSQQESREQARIKNPGSGTKG